MKTLKIRSARGSVMAVAVCCLLTVTMATAQSGKTAKQAESLEKAGEASKKSVEDVLKHLGGMLEQYNSLVDGDVSEKKSQSAYKKLVGDLGETEKKVDGLKKEGASLDKEADKFFKAWEKDLSTISSDSLRGKSEIRLEASRAKYASIGDVLGQAGEILAPVVQNLNDQILYMGRDLSPDALGDLNDEAAELNTQAEEATTKIQELLDSTGEAAAAEGEAAAGEDESEAGAEGEEATAGG